MYHKIHKNNIGRELIIPKMEVLKATAAAAAEAIFNNTVRSNIMMLLPWKDILSTTNYKRYSTAQ